MGRVVGQKEQINEERQSLTQMQSGQHVNWINSRCFEALAEKHEPFEKEFDGKEDDLIHESRVCVSAEYSMDAPLT